MIYEYKAILMRVVDGDTVDAMIDLGFDTWLKKRIRLAGINAYESRTRNKAEKKKGLKAKARLTEILEENDGDFLLISHGVGKYGRCLGEIRANSKSVNKMLIKEGHATKYEC